MLSLDLTRNSDAHEDACRLCYFNLFYPSKVKFLSSFYFWILHVKYSFLPLQCYFFVSHCHYFKILYNELSLLSLRCQTKQWDWFSESFGQWFKQWGRSLWCSVRPSLPLVPMANIYKVHPSYRQTERRCLPFTSHYSGEIMLKASLKCLHEVNPKCLW